MFRLVPLFLILTACVAYGQAPAVRPPSPPPVMTPGYFPGSTSNPTYTPAGAGLPGERVPGKAAPAVERSKNRRALPASDKPGIWAADGDPALASNGQPLGWMVLDVAVPAPDVEDPDFGSLYVMACASKTHDALKANPTLYREVMRLTQDERTCLIARLLRWCVEGATRSTTPERSGYADAQASLTTAAKFKKQTCNEKTETYKVRDLEPQVRPLYTWEPKR